MWDEALEAPSISRCGNEIYGTVANVEPRTMFTWYRSGNMSLNKHVRAQLGCVFFESLALHGCGGCVAAEDALLTKTKPTLCGS